MFNSIKDYIERLIDHIGNSLVEFDLEFFDDEI